MAFKSWPDIESLHHVAKDVADARPVVFYRGKVKLHGTNAGVRVDPDGVVTAQSRTRDLTVDSDNYGFAVYAGANAEHFAQGKTDVPIIFFGEWAGQGINAGDAVSKLPKRFYVFAVVEVEPCATSPDGEKRHYYVDPGIIELLWGDTLAAVGAAIIPWADEGTLVDFGDPVKTAEWAARLSEQVVAIGEHDPYIATLGAGGPGEGLVMYALSSAGANQPHPGLGRLMFKAKAERHTGIKTRAPRNLVSTDPVLVASVEEFVQTFVTDARLQQGVDTVCGGVFQIEKTGEFLKWLNGDVAKETARELEDAGLTWKNVSKRVNEIGSRWYRARIMGVA